ncbi:MAG: 3-phosphoshikimate 1-carboxyvinyltransferase, partial [Candidatus Limnocylindrales bacterium]
MDTSVAGSETARRVAPTKRLRGEIVLPGDKSISHRALMLALLANGKSRITGAGDGADVQSTAGVLTTLGASVTRSPGVAGNVDYDVRSPGIDGLHPPAETIDCGNSGTSLRLFAGILA